MAGTDYILVEFDPEADSEDEVRYCIDELVEAGYKPIIAHVERYRFTDVQSVTDFRDRGAEIQISAFSVQNEANAHIRNMANDLLAKQLVDYVGTDAHGMDQRPPMIWEGARVIESTYGEVYARRILVENTRRLILED
jgi:protein-tyrosine phosphatase